jgi:hypothetical protein
VGKLKFQRILCLVTARMCRERCITPTEINTGFCLLFAEQVLWETQGACQIMYKPGGHSFLLYRGGYYDAEQHRGVRHWRHLPFFRRAARVSQQRDETNARYLRKRGSVNHHVA